MEELPVLKCNLVSFFQVTVLIGDPINFDDLLYAEKVENVPRKTLYDAVATRIGNRLHEMKVQVTNLAIEQELKTSSTHIMERASGIFQQVDWELFGMGSSMSEHEDSKQRQESLSPTNVNGIEPQHSHDQQNNSRTGFSYRMRGYMDQMELMSFAARGIFLNSGSSTTYTYINPLRAWKQFLEANLLRHWNYC